MVKARKRNISKVFKGTVIASLQKYGEPRLHSPSYLSSLDSVQQIPWTSNKSIPIHIHGMIC